METLSKTQISKALSTLDVLEKSDSRLKAVARSGLLKMSAKKTTEQPPVKTIVKTSPVAKQTPQQVKTVTKEPAPTREPLRWGQTPTYIGQKIENTPRPQSAQTPRFTPPAAPATRPPDMAGSLRASKIDQSKLTGHQLVAQKCGLDINTPGLEKMSMDQMKAQATETQRAWAKEQASKQGIYYGPKGETYHRK